MTVEISSLEKELPQEKRKRFKEYYGIENEKEIELFFSDYKKLEKGKIDFVKVEGWRNAQEAEEIIKKAISAYEV